MKITFILGTIISLGNSLINSYYAPLALELGINESIVGMIISIFSLMIIIVTPFNSLVINKIGRKNIFLLTLFLQVNKVFYQIIDLRIYYS